MTGVQTCALPIFTREIFNAVYVSRQRSADEDPLEPLMEALRHGDSLVIFPEGTRGHAADPAPFKAGLYHLAEAFPEVVRLTSIGRTPEGRELWWRCYLPYAAWNFAILPSLYAPLGPWAVFSVWSNLLMAEALTNLHAFIVIVPNHAGADLSRFPAPTSSRQEFYLRQILSSANYPCGDDWTDFLHGGLNYQIEHHLFPDLSMLQYRRCQPLVKALCARHGVPYVQESVWRRLRRTVAIMNGQATMRRHPGTAAPEASAAAG